MSVTNHGPSRADGVRLIDPLPVGMAFVSVTSNKGTCAGGTTVACDLGDLEVGTRATVSRRDPDGCRAAFEYRICLVGRSGRERFQAGERLLDGDRGRRWPAST